MALIDITKVEQEVKDELRKEAEAHAKAKIKGKLKELETARTVVANLERELADIKASIADGN